MLKQPTALSVVTEPAFTGIAEPTTEPNKKKILLDFALSPDGKYLAVYLNTGVYIYDNGTLDYVAITEFESDKYYSQFNSYGEYYPPLSAPGAVTFSPDGKEIAISGKFQDELIRIWDWKNKKALKVVANYPNGNFVQELEYSSDGNALLVRSTYPLSILHCESSEDSLTLTSLNPPSDFIIKKLFEIQGCKPAPIEFYFTDTNKLFFVQVTESDKYWMYEIDTRTGDILQFNEYNVNLDGIVYGFSQNGKIYAVREYPSVENF